MRLTVIPDLHVPYHDADRLAEAVSDCRKSDHIILLGDLLDAYPLMSHLKNPARAGNFSDEIEQAIEVLAGIRHAAGSDARIDLILGNHEDRLRRYVWANAPLLGERIVRNLDDALELDRFNIQMHQPSGFKAYNARFKHGDIVRNKAGYTARCEMERHRLSGFSGHTHRMGSASHTDRERVTTEWWECGHLVDVSKADYVTSPDWQAGYVVANIKNGLLRDVTPVRL
jgi:predicted phosphodiesterase